MKTRITQTLVAALLTIAVMTATTHAGLTDLLGTKAKASQATSASFDQLYSSVTASRTAPDNVVMSANAIVGFNSPAGKGVHVSRQTLFVEVSGYNSEVAQCDDSPFITASGTHVRWGVVAANMLPIGTHIKIPSLFGDQIFVVEDRMNSRYQHNVDVWFAEHSDAVKLGRRHLAIEVIR